jgi:pyrophosphatase PpaX
MTNSDDITFQAVLFDLDGTLINSIDHIVDCWQHTVRTCLGREIEREVVLPTIGRSLLECFEEIAPGRSDELFGVYQAYEVHHDERISLVPGTRETLDHLKLAGLPLGVVTSKGLEIAGRGLALFDLTNYFDTLITREATQRHKPYPDPLLEASRRMGIPPEQMIYVGDALVDIQAGKAAGMSTAWVEWGAEHPSRADGVRPDYVFSTMQDVLVLAPTRRVDAPQG